MTSGQIISPRTYRRYRFPGVRLRREPDTYLVDFIDHNGNRRFKTFKGSEADAHRFRVQLTARIQRIRAGLEPSPDLAVQVPTLAHLWDQFHRDRTLRINAGSMQPGSLARTRNSFDALVKFTPQLADTLISEIEPSVFEEFKAHRIGQGFKPEGINTNLRGLRTVFNFALKEKLLDRSPLAGVQKVSVRESDVRFLDEHELRRLNEVVDSIDLTSKMNKDARDLTVLYLHTGARTSEVLLPHFTWDCINSNAIHFPSTKGDKTRTIPLSASVAEILDSRRSIPDGPFPFTRDIVYKRVKMVLDLSGIPRASTHTLRKSAGAWYYMATKDIFATSRFLGHSSVKVTEKHYAGLIQSLQVEYSDQFEEALNAQ